MTPREKIHFTLRYVAEHFNMDPQTLLDRGDCEPVVAIRHMAIWAIRQVVPTVTRNAAIGRELGRDRTTIKNSCNRARTNLARSAWWRETANGLVAEIRHEIERNVVVAFPCRGAQKERAETTA